MRRRAFLVLASFASATLAALHRTPAAAAQEARPGPSALPGPPGQQLAQLKQQMIQPPAGQSQRADVQAHPECLVCGMNRETFAHARMLVESQNGVRPTCSLNCALVVMAAEWNKRVFKLQVGDYKTKELIDARSATWVIGGDKRGVMHPRGKWAFANPADAKAFVTESGGEVSTFDQALTAASKDLYERILPRPEGPAKS